LCLHQVTLALDGELTYTPCAKCYDKDRIYFTVLEKRLDNNPALSVDGVLEVEITGVNEAPKMHMYDKGRNVVPTSSAVTLPMEQNNGNAEYRDAVFIVAGYDADYKDVLDLTVQRPTHGTLTVYRQVTNVELVEQDCTQSWNTRQIVWGSLISNMSTLADVDKVYLPTPCNANFETTHMAWVAVVVKYVPSEDYFGEDVIKVRHLDSCKMLLLNCIWIVAIEMYTLY